MYTNSRKPVLCSNEKGPASPALTRLQAAPHSTAFTMSSTTFLASPKTIMVLSM
jgi:hypothetical protein